MTTEPKKYASPGERSRIAMLYVGLLALIIGGIWAYRGWQDSQSGASIAEALGAPVPTPDFTQFWIGIGIAGAGVILLFALWVIKAARK